MTITKLQGGLGNQMFQYAIAYSYSKTVYLDFSFLKKHKSSNHQFTKRDFELSLFPRLKYYEFTESLRNLYFSNNRKYRLLRKFFRIKINIIRQKENEFISIEKSNNIYLDGFFQSEQYFLSKRKELLSVFKFPALDKNNEAIKNEIIAHSNSVSLHIRRGDYLKEEVKKYHGILDQKYYDSAIEIIKKKYNDVHFYVFSDDENFAKEKYGDSENFTIVEGNTKDAWKDMALMSFCKHHIIANSSFSWWGAWLSESKESIKIAPISWFNSEIANFDIHNIVPKNWIKI